MGWGKAVLRSSPHCVGRSRASGTLQAQGEPGWGGRTHRRRKKNSRSALRPGGDPRRPPVPPISSSCASCNSAPAEPSTTLRQIHRRFQFLLGPHPLIPQLRLFSFLSRPAGSRAGEEPDTPAPARAPSRRGPGGAGGTAAHRIIWEGSSAVTQPPCCNLLGRK